MAEMTGRKGGTSFDEESGNYIYYARNQTASSFMLFALTCESECAVMTCESC